MLSAMGAHVDGVGSCNEWLDKLPLNNSYDYERADYRQMLDTDAYHFVFDCATGKRFVYYLLKIEA